MKSSIRILAAVAGLFIAASAAAQPAPPPIGWVREFGVGVIANPEFQGGDSYQARPIPYVDVRYRDENGVKYFANVPQGVGGYLYRSGASQRKRTAVALSIAPGFATRDDGIPGLEEVGPATEARLTFTRERGAWTAGAVFAADLGTGHEGAYVDLTLQRSGRIGRRGFWSLGPALRIVDSDYAEAQYGIRPADAPLAGLPVHDAGEGAEQVSIGGVLSLPVHGKWRLTTVARVGGILGDRGDSPIVESRTQAFLLIAVTRPF